MLRVIMFVETCLVALLVGMLWSTSIVIAPAVFEAAPNSAVAGAIATELFARVIRLAIVLSAALMVIGLVMRPAWNARSVIAAVTTILLLLGLQYGVTIWMADARAAGATRETIMQLHALAAVVYFAACLAVLLLLAKRREEGAAV